MVLVTDPSDTLHSFILPSAEPEAMICPSGEIATLSTRSSEEFSPRVRITDPSDTRHSFIMLSYEPEARVCPSGEIATLSTEPVCPVRVRGVGAGVGVGVGAPGNCGGLPYLCRAQKVPNWESSTS